MQQRPGLSLRMTKTLLRRLKRKILREIYGPIKEKDTWRIKKNRELKEIKSLRIS